MMSEIDSHINSMFSSASYRLGTVLVDAGDEWEGFEGVGAVLLTHAHFDHIYGLNRLVEMNPVVRIYTNDAGREMLLDAKKNLSRYHDSPFVFQYSDRIVTVNDGVEIEVGEDMTAKAIFTPGHNASCISWIVGDAFFTGDSYIPGIKTVTNLPGADKTLASQSERLILSSAYRDKTIYPGHAVGE